MSKCPSFNTQGQTQTLTSDTTDTSHTHTAYYKIIFSKELKKIVYVHMSICPAFITHTGFEILKKLKFLSPCPNVQVSTHRARHRHSHQIQSDTSHTHTAYYKIIFSKELKK